MKINHTFGPKIHSKHLKARGFGALLWTLSAPPGSPTASWTGPLHTLFLDPPLAQLMSVHS